MKWVFYAIAGLVYLAAGAGMFGGVIVALGAFVEWLPPFAEIEALTIAAFSGINSTAGVAPLDVSDLSTAPMARRVAYGLTVCGFSGWPLTIAARILVDLDRVPRDIWQSDAYQRAVAVSKASTPEPGPIMITLLLVGAVMMFGPFLLGFALITAEWAFGAANIFSKTVAALSPGLYDFTLSFMEDLADYVWTIPFAWGFAFVIMVGLYGSDRLSGIWLFDANGKPYIYELPGASERYKINFWLILAPILLGIVTPIIHVVLTIAIWSMH